MTEFFISLGLAMLAGAVAAGYKFLKKKVEQTPTKADNWLLRKARKLFEKK